MTRRGWGMLIAALAIFLAARVFGIRELQMVSVAMLVAVLGALAQTWSGISKINVDRAIAPAVVSFGEQAIVTLTVNNLSGRPTTPLELLDAVPDGFASPDPVRLGVIRAYRSAVVTYELDGTRRGKATIGPLQVRTADPFGIVMRTKSFAMTGTVTVLPPVVPLPAGLVLESATTGSRGGSHRVERDGREFAGIREYVDGDDLRTVHWASTAHRGKLIVRRSEAPHAPTALVLLDVRADRQAGSGPTASIESVVAAGASVAYHLAVRGRAVAVVDRPMVRPPQPAPWDVLIGRLAEVQPADVDLEATMRQVAQGMTGNGTFIAVVTTPDARELRQLIRSARGFATRAVMVVDPPSHDDRGGSRQADSAVAALRVAGIRSTVVRRGDQLDQRWTEIVASTAGAQPSGARMSGVQLPGVQSSGVRPPTSQPSSASSRRAR
ncbi:MAG: DUF58 domain-containing protein [Nitriliruptoraceae bacterium]